MSPPGRLSGPVVLSLALLYWYSVEAAVIYCLYLPFKTFTALGWLLLLLLLQRGGKAKQQTERIGCGEKQKRSRKVKMAPVELKDLENCSVREDLSATGEKL